MELDHLDRIAASAFDGYLVRKDLVRRYSRQYPVPTYVVEFLLGRYCATVDEQEIEEGLKIVERQLQDRTVRTSEQELFKARAREKGSVKLIDIVKARLDAKTDSFLVELPSLGLQGRADRRHARPRARADADRRLLRRGDADLRRGDRGGEARPAVRHREPAGDPALQVGRAGHAEEGPQAVHHRRVEGLPASVDRPGAGGDVGPGEDGGAAADGPVRGAELQPRRTRPARDGQEPPVPADFALLAPDIRRQGDRREDVREHVQRPARAWCASTTWCASTRCRASRSTRRTA